MSCTLPKFRYGQAIQHADLLISIFDAQGPVQPERVTYTLFFNRPECSPKPVGPEQRRPVIGKHFGEYHASGVAGELDQPGCWVIRWEFQLTLQKPIQVAEQCFHVLDAVTAADPRDTTVRVQKRGWN